MRLHMKEAIQSHPNIIGIIGNNGEMDLPGISGRASLNDMKGAEKQ